VGVARRHILNAMDIVTYLSLVLVTFGLITTTVLLILLVRKLSVLENLFLSNWVEVTTGMTFMLLGIFSWFIAEAIEDFSPTVYGVALPFTFTLLIIGELVLVLVIVRRPK